MKTRWVFALPIAWVFLFFSFSFSLHAQNDIAADSTGLPGDNFSLEGALDLFKKAASPEDFEKLLNSEDRSVNNLDLNEDGEIDYIRVIDNMDGDAHAIVLQVPVNETESQDIAVIEIEKNGPEEAMLQIVGNEDIFGKQVLVEPFEAEKINNGRGGPAANFGPVPIVVNVWLWPSVRFVYGPRYAVWVSPWHWRHYPGYWRPWRPYPLYRYHVRVAPYRTHYCVSTTHRVVRANAVYAPRRTSSTIVRTRTTTVVSRNGRNGTTGAVRRTTTTNTVRGQNGRAVEKSTTTTKVGRQGRNGNRAGGQKTTKSVTRRRGRQ